MQIGAKSFPQSHDHPLLKISRIYVHNTNTKGQTPGSCGLWVVGHIHVAGLSGDVRHGGGAGASHQAAFPLAAVRCMQV